MIYTLGHRLVYLKGIIAATEKKPFLKTGWYRSSDEEVYPGGSVWQTPEEVWAYIDGEGERLKEYSVFAVDAEWEGGTLIMPYSWRALANSSPIIKEIPRG